MSLLKAVIVAWIWCVACAFIMNHGAGIEISNDIQILTVAIVVAGALVGGDK